MINKLVSKIQKTEAPIVVGLDPMMKFIPEHITKAAFAEHGETLEGAAEAIWQYNKAIVDNIYDLIPAVKPQIAMYEQFGIPGIIAYKKTIEYCKSKDLVVIGDIKRGDIGSTSEAYAVGHMGKVQVGSNSFYGFDEDFATLAPYMGSDTINPFKKVCQEEKKGLFILVKTSNPSSGEFQDRLIDGRPLYEWVAEKVVEWGSDFMGDSYSYIGAVVGATYPEMGKVLREIMPKSFILVPGYGAQGGKGADLVHFFNKDGLGALWLQALITLNGLDYPKLKSRHYRVEMLNINSETGEFECGKMETFSPKYGWLPAGSKLLVERTKGFFSVKTDYGMPADFFQGVKFKTSPKRDDVYWYPPLLWYGDNQADLDKVIEEMKIMYRTFETDYDKLFNE